VLSYLGNEKKPILGYPKTECEIVRDEQNVNTISDTIS